jgi:type IV secretory pathway VirB3-like protein
MYTYIYIYIYIHVYVCVCLCVRARVYVCVYVCVYCLLDVYCFSDSVRCVILYNKLERERDAETGTENSRNLPYYFHNIPITAMEIRK